MQVIYGFVSFFLSFVFVLHKGRTKKTQSNDKKKKKNKTRKGPDLQDVVSWKDWFLLSKMDPDMEFTVTGSDCNQCIEDRNDNTAYAMTGDSFGCYWVKIYEIKQFYGSMCVCVPVSSVFFLRRSLLFLEHPYKNIF